MATAVVPMPGGEELPAVALVASDKNEDSPPASIANGQSPPTSIANGQSPSTNGPESDMSIIPRHINDDQPNGPESDISIIPRPDESMSNLNEKLQASPDNDDKDKKIQDLMKALKTLVAQNQQLKSALVSTNKQLQDQIHRVALQKQQQEDAGASEAAKENDPEKLRPFMSDDTFTLPEATQLKADAFMLRQKLERAEQARKDLVHINQGLHRQVAELQKNNDELQKGMMVSSHSNGSPQSVENGFCMVEPMSRSSQSQASVGEVDEALVTMQLQSKQEEIQTLQDELLQKKEMERQNSEKIQSLVSEMNVAEATKGELEKQVGSLQSQVRSLLMELNDMRKQYDLLSRNHKTLQMNNDHQMSEQQTKLLKQQDTIVSLQGMISGFEADKVDYQQKYQKMQAELRQRNSALTELRKDHHALCVQHQETRDLLQDENRKLRVEMEQMKQLGKTVTDLRDEKEAYKAQADCFRADFEAERKAREEAQAKANYIEDQMKKMQDGVHQRDLARQEEMNARSITEIRQRHGRVPMTPNRTGNTLVRKDPPLDPGFVRGVQQEPLVGRRPEAAHMDRAPSRAQELTCPKCKLESPDEDSFHLHLADCIQ